GPVPESSKAPPVTPGDSVSDNSVPSDSVPSDSVPTDTVPAELPAGQFLARIKPVKRSVKTAAPVEVRERNALPIELPPVPIPAPPRSPRIIEATPEVRESVPPVRRSPGARTESVPTKELPADLAFSVEANESIRPRPTAAGAGLTTATAPAREATPPQGLVPPEQIPERIRVALEKGQREVRIRLDPPELGTLDVRIAVDGTDVRLTVRAEHAEASQLLQQSLQDLRLRLSQSGLQLVDADVDIATGDDGGGGRGDASRDRRERPSEDLADVPATERHKTKSKAVRAIA
ncbi:MAG: flagellar hook-length control protein FliK, partial [Myxococcota bacterium]